MVSFVEMLAFIAMCNLLGISFANEYPSCGDCWCVPENEGTAPCPIWQPPSNYSASTLSVYSRLSPIAYYALSCNPYLDSNCKTTPEQSYIDSEDAVCAYLYPTSNGTTCSNYSMVTYSTREEALRAGAAVTHKGSCGLCSTTQDLAMYLTQDFTQAGKVCATKGLFNEQAGLQCYMDIGLTEECAKIWNYDGIYDGKICGATCAGDLTAPNNGPPPTCTLNDCLQCDEEYAGPIFSKFAGRTRRRSGLQSEIIRNCSSIAKIIQEDPCLNPACGC